MLKKVLIAVLGLAVLAGAGWGAEIENKITLQGRLVDPATDAPKPIGSYTVSLYLWPTASGGMAVTGWNPKNILVSITDNNGVFNYEGLDVSGLDMTKQYWVSFSLTGTRFGLRPAPYAIQLTPGDKVVSGPGHLTINSDDSKPALYLTDSNKDIAWPTGQTLQLGVWNGTTFTEKARITNAGNLDITGDLDVAGTIKLSPPERADGDSTANVFWDKISHILKVSDRLPMVEARLGKFETIALAPPSQPEYTLVLEPIYLDGKWLWLAKNGMSIDSALIINKGELTTPPWQMIAGNDFLLKGGDTSLFKYTKGGLFEAPVINALSGMKLGGLDVATQNWVTGQSYLTDVDLTGYSLTTHAHDFSTLTGALTAAQIPNLDAGKITAGTFATARIPNLDAGKITTGTFATAQIPNLDAGKITTGTFAAARIPNLDAGKITTGAFAAARIPNLDAGKITTGAFVTARIADGAITSAKILDGAITNADLAAGTYGNITGVGTLNGLQVGNGNITLQRDVVQANMIIDGPAGGYAYNGVVIKGGGTEEWFMGRNGYGNNENFIIRRNASSNDLLINTTNGNVGIGGTPDPQQALHVVGSIGYTVGLMKISDLRLKSNLAPIGNALTSLDQLRGIRFDWNDTAEGLGYPNGRQIGLIAQEVEKVYPELVTTQKDGYKGVDYAAFTPVLIEAIKELKAENDALKARVELLEASKK